MENDKLEHGMIVERVKERLVREHKEIEENTAGNPDIILKSHGLALANIQVETERGITPEGADRWKKISETGTRLILMIPKHAKKKATELLWDKGILDRVSIGTYEIRIEMP